MAPPRWVTTMAPKVHKARETARKSPPRSAANPKLLSGGNPQIAKAEGDGAVQAYIGR
jgi:hypothetical protein